MATSLSQFRKVMPALVDQRAAPRHAVSVTRATVRRHGDPAHEATLDDLSIYGCRLSSPPRADADEAPGERLWLRFAGGMPVAATVVWSRPGAIGCRFDAPLDRAVVRALTLVIC